MHSKEIFGLFSIWVELFIAGFCNLVERAVQLCQIGASLRENTGLCMFYFT